MWILRVLAETKQGVLYVSTGVILTAAKNVGGVPSVNTDGGDTPVDNVEGGVYANTDACGVVANPVEVPKYVFTKEGVTNASTAALRKVSGLNHAGANMTKPVDFAESAVGLDFVNTTDGLISVRTA